MLCFVIIKSIRLNPRFLQTCEALHIVLFDVHRPQIGILYAVFFRQGNAFRLIFFIRYGTFSMNFYSFKRQF